MDEKKKKKRTKYYAELVSFGDDTLTPVLEVIKADPDQIYFCVVQVDTSDASGSNRTKYVFSQYMSNSISPMKKAKVNSYLGDIKTLVSKADLSLMTVASDNYETELSPKSISEGLHRSGSHKPDVYNYGTMGEYRMN